MQPIAQPTCGRLAQVRRSLDHCKQIGHAVRRSISGISRPSSSVRCPAVHSFRQARVHKFIAFAIDQPN
jgi:hypothetical protein